MKIWSPSGMCFLQEEITKKKNPAILLYSHATAQGGEAWRRHSGNPQIKPKITIPCNKFMGSIDSSDMKLYTYLDERWIVHYCKKVAFNIVARMVLNSYILYKEKYRGPDKLKSRHNYNVSLIENLGEEWLALKDNAGAEDPWRPQGLRKLPEKKEFQGTACITKESRATTVYTSCNMGLHGESFANCKNYTSFTPMVKRATSVHQTE
ncbi:hypothetical protein B7P43_G17130 [Cryptotermes secundus]|uniref:PiggyBac transposable element-derived protein domain-containing protein n=1 Tax=Cryptotermes secundus TaxID=105785 RepID=A0A2J7RD05_9NEOP|nr:hypothetical protein B7P43_G17130 [Cryptotermes secundus]